MNYGIWANYTGKQPYKSHWVDGAMAKDIPDIKNKYNIEWDGTFISSDINAVYSYIRYLETHAIWTMYSFEVKEKES